ncbi:MAG: nucleotidyltransferase domain-containing protein [Bacillota bacterium]
MNLDRVTRTIAQVDGVKAVALGGSHSRGEADQHSDYDIGIYYWGDQLDLQALDQAVRSLDDGHRDGLLNPPGAWGRWINGGAWITVDSVPVDILLRDLTWVESVVSSCLAGEITIDYQAGHPFGFVNTIYAAETHYCRPLWQDQSAPLDRLKALLHSNGAYAPAMKEAVIHKFLWEAWFSLACGRKAALKGELHYAMGSVFRAVCAWLQVLFALNNRYLMNEKGALNQVYDLQRKPADMEMRIKDAYRLFADGEPQKAYEIVDALHAEVEKLAVSNAELPEWKIR